MPARSPLSEVFYLDGRIEEVALRLLLAGAAGVLTGLPFSGGPGGVRTHVFVTVGAALFSATALRMAAAAQADVLRVLQGITSGIGFVGAASVLRQRGSISGTTTAASIWISAAIGCEAMLGSGWMVLIVTLLVTAFGFMAGYLGVRVGPGRRFKPQTRREKD